MFVTDTNENNVFNWNTKMQIVTKSYSKTLKRLKVFRKIFLCNRITMTVALEAYLKPNETSTMEFFYVNN